MPAKVPCITLYKSKSKRMFKKNLGKYIDFNGDGIKIECEMCSKGVSLNLIWEMNNEFKIEIFRDMDEYTKKLKKVTDGHIEPELMAVWFGEKLNKYGEAHLWVTCPSCCGIVNMGTPTDDEDINDDDDIDMV
mmetsp:Transcript_18731/g.23019  ORF Transcript_18731/g.23019 Transcript_18731/m.23019 type:complete len:133 (-) Transcript_18731:6-404(-)